MIVRLQRLLGAVLVIVVLAGPSAQAADARAPRVTAFRVGGPITLDTNLVSDSGVSAWAIDEYLAQRTDLPPLGASFIAAERRYGVNARFLLAAAMHESGWGSSTIARIKHNLFGFTAYDRDPVGSATAWDDFASCIDTTAAFIRTNYLTPGARFWMGAPTLRSMQVRWSSSGVWGERVSALASSMPLRGLAGRSITVDAPTTAGAVHPGDRVPVTVTWSGPALPDGIVFSARWEPVALDADVIAATAGPASAATTDAPVLASAVAARPAGATAPLAAERDGTAAVRAARVRTASRSIVLAVAAPWAPGAYRLHVQALDAGGAPLPVVQRFAIPATDVRIWADRAVAVELAATDDGRGLEVTVTNTGTTAIPATTGAGGTTSAAGAAGASGSSGAAGPGHIDAREERTVISVAALDRPGGSVLASLASVPLEADLAPGAAVSLSVDGIDAAVGRTAAWLSVNVQVVGDPGPLPAYAPVGAWRWAGTLGPATLGAAGSGSWSAPAPRAVVAPPPPPAPPPAPVTTSYNEHNPAIAYTGTWADAPYPDYGGGAVAWSTKSGSTATLTFTGSSVTWFGPKGPTRGKAAILVDGVEVARVDLWARHFSARELIYRHTFAASGPHTITIRVLASPGHPYVAIDELRVRS